MRFLMGFAGGSMVMNPPANAEDIYSIPGSGRSPAKGNGNPLQYSCLENPMVRRSWWATVPWCHKSVGQNLATEQQYCRCNLPRFFSLPVPYTPAFLR